MHVFQVFHGYSDAQSSCLSFFGFFDMPIALAQLVDSTRKELKSVFPELIGEHFQNNIYATSNRGMKRI